MLRVCFENLTIEEQEVLTVALFSRADSWLGWGASRENDNVLRSLGRIFQISMRGMWATFRSIFSDRDSSKRKPSSLSIARTTILLFLAAALAWGGQQMHAQGTHAQTQANAGSPQAMLARRGATSDINAPVPPGEYHDHFTLADAGESQLEQIELHSIDTQHSIYFTLPETHVVGTAKIHVHYAFSPSLIPQLSHLKLIMNGTLFATIQPTPGQNGGSDSRDAEADFTIPSELLVHNNTLTIEFIGHYTMDCEDPANTTLWARVFPQHLSSTFAAICCIWPTTSSNCPCRSSIPPSFSRSVFPWSFSPRPL